MKKSWALEKFPDIHWTVERRNDGLSVCFVGRQHIDLIAYSMKEIESIAQLISAAPEMYEALKAVKRARMTAIVDDEFPKIIAEADFLLEKALNKVDGE